MRHGTDPLWFDRAPCGLLTTSLDGAILDVNDTLSHWTGIAREELLGQPFARLLDRGSQLFFETRHRQMLHLQGSVNEVSLTLQTAAGMDLPVLVNAVRDPDTDLVRYAVFNATERVRYERELLTARRIAEQSERRVRVLQEVSAAFGLSASDEDLAQTFVRVARDAFSANEAAVLLTHDDASLVLTAGKNPLDGKVAPVRGLREATEVTVVYDDDTVYPELAKAIRDEPNLTALSVMPLIAEDERLGVLVCFFSSRTEFDEHFFDLQKALGRQASQTLQRVRLQRQLALLALHDQLTGLANRQLLQHSLDEALASTTAGEPLAVLFLDVDEFKSINDSFGHAAGDMVLVELGKRLRAGVRAGDMVGRLGGDEFAAVCPGADAQAAQEIAQRILAVCRQPIPVPGGIVSASVSVGISLHHSAPVSEGSAQLLLVRADAAMYEAKRAGKDRATIDGR